MLIFVYGIGIFLYAFVANYILHRAARRFWVFRKDFKNQPKKITFDVKIVDYD
jgi:hypothetical protein